MTISGSTIASNTAVGGGGIFDMGSTVTISNTVFSANSGGGVTSQGGSLMTITDSQFLGNSAGAGGGLLASGATVTLTTTTFSGNYAAGAGGGIYGNSSELIVSASTFSGNSTGGYGGGIICDTFGILTITNTTVSGNSAGIDGGGIANTTFSSVNITNSTVTGNRADADGGGTWGSGGGLYNGEGTSASLHNSLIAGNMTGAPGGDNPDDISGDATNVVGSFNLIGDATTSGGLTNGVNGNIVANGGSDTIVVSTIIDVNLADNGGPTLTHALVPGSLAINAGDNSKAVDADGDPLLYEQRGAGFARIADGQVDIGAFEVQVDLVQVDIDVKPGSDPNSINLASQGLIAVAILTTNSFDASLVDATSVVFSGAHAVHSALEDTDGDGDLDLVLHFAIQETNLADLYAQLLADDINDEDGILDSNHQTAAVSLTGHTATDEYFEGLDELDLFLSGKNLRDFLEDLAAAGVI
jgi:predicted outer membrane repeat protein